MRTRVLIAIWLCCALGVLLGLMRLQMANGSGAGKKRSLPELATSSAPSAGQSVNSGDFQSGGHGLENAVYSADLTFFEKWRGAVLRQNGIQKQYGRSWPRAWQQSFAVFSGLSLADRLRGVNALINGVPFLSDENGWQRVDYWAAPMEFFAKGGGDCEDYAIAKYFALLSLGVPERRLRIGVVKDLRRGENHALLLVDIRGLPDAGVRGNFAVLDNQDPVIKAWEDVAYYRPLYSINRLGWWNHTVPEGREDEILASGTAAYQRLVDKRP